MSSLDLVQIGIGGHRRGLMQTLRQDRWWLGPGLTFLGLSTFLLYSTWAMLQGNHYFADPYLSPMYSPVLWAKSGVPGAVPLHHAWFGEWPGWMPAIVPASPAFLILAIPGSFRFTCYYYRKAYYRSFAALPPGCAVGPLPKKPYNGETVLLLFQNLHRFALSLSLILLVILAYDGVSSYFREGKFGLGVGSIVLTINPLLLGSYTFGCHSYRHLIGGHLNSFSDNPISRVRYRLWKHSTWLNERHMQFAWISLFWVMLSDAYVRLVSWGVIRDLNTWN